MRHTPAKRRLIIWPALLALPPLALLLAASWGSGGWVWPFAADGAMQRVVLELRLPRAIAALVTGAMLAQAGCLMQVLLRNPLADPYVLGLSGGAAAFALIGMSLGLSFLPVPLLAFAGAMLTMIIVFVLARGRGPWSTTRVLLTGVVIAAGWGALISLILATGPDASLRSMLYWLMGDLSQAGLSALWLLPLAAGVGLLWLRARSLNVMSGGELQAALLGESARARFWEIYVVASLLTALAVSLAGAIGFVGLIVPHLMRLLVGADHRVLLPASALFGGGFLVLADTAARSLLGPRQLPVGVLTALIGVPLFLLLLYRAARIR
ncbi:iron ABC transporter permease [Wenzhouxiangella sp. XN201]|uniref:FecCD family ABC transporter permease n=1 Tax=Wenzhouxiangella sp. XN201 TaxID=2710755 RepID=UPI0013CAC742|nr:iron ABC transporter permease [Wenzhouxiangella sp. XN201]NEZ04429.1 iron ABC transporter permease [Wenzhouxiangella sp. XN201]